MKNIALVIAYDGTHYLGWQATKEGPSIEEELKKVLQQILQEPIILQAASRTDACVHAFGQVVNFTTSHAHLCLQQLHKSLNSLLPKDISILEICEKSPRFHPTLDCTGKEYHYYICNDFAQMPQFRLYSWHYSYPLNLALMHQASQHFLGEHDFSAFCNVKKTRVLDKSTREIGTDQIRCLSKLDIIPLPRKRLRIEIAGNHFLYKMVRNIVGTLAYIGRGKIPPDQIEHILSAKNRTLAGVTAPGNGLHLVKVFY
jgi:tRNA pseudouridine38-40 synthase